MKSVRKRLFFAQIILIFNKNDQKIEKFSGFGTKFHVILLEFSRKKKKKHNEYRGGGQLDEHDFFKFSGGGQQPGGGSTA